MNLLRIPSIRRAPLLGRMALGLLVAGPAALSLVPAPALAQSAPDANAQVLRAAEALRAIPSMRADFIQRGENSGQQVSGVMSLKRPGKIRFEYQRGYPVLIVSDGRALTIVDSQVNHTQRWPIGNSPLGALLDPAKDITRYGSVLPSADPRILIVQVEDRRRPQYGVMVLTFVHNAAAPGGLELAGWQTIDAQKRRTTIRLSGHRYGVDLGDDLFTVMNTNARPHK